MLWLINDKITNFTFIQLFPSYKKYKDTHSNLLYNFNIDFDNSLEIKDIVPLIVSYTIFIKDNFIQFQNNIKTITWEIENEFVKETDELNKHKQPYFKWKYNLVDNHKLPNTLKKNYDSVYQNVLFKIFKINENKLFVIEQNNNKLKKYYLEI